MMKATVRLIAVIAALLGIMATVGFAREASAEPTPTPAASSQPMHRMGNSTGTGMGSGMTEMMMGGDPVDTCVKMNHAMDSSMSGQTASPSPMRSAEPGSSGK
ncbi:hypothetical protein EPN44_01245 [bacterium]|nr:MAG: hypothetical protein EPN44_01245 [bacterium]